MSMRTYAYRKWKLRENYEPFEFWKYAPTHTDLLYGLEWMEALLTQDV